MSEKKVLLRDLDSQQSQPFEAAHAQRLLAYPGTRWVALGEDTAPTAPKPEAAAAKKKPAAAADSTRTLPEA